MVQQQYRFQEAEALKTASHPCGATRSTVRSHGRSGCRPSGPPASHSPRAPQHLSKTRGGGSAVLKVPLRASLHRRRASTTASTLTAMKAPPPPEALLEFHNSN